MGINEHISDIKEYFREFNILDELSYVFVSFPENWTIPDEKYLKERFKTEISKQKDGYYFVSDLENGTDLVFEAIKHTITLNKKLEQKYALFNRKTEELITVFKENDLEVLETLEFVFNKKPSSKLIKLKEVQTKKSSPKRGKRVAKNVESRKDDEPKIVIPKEDVEEKVVKETPKQEDKDTENLPVTEGGLMDFANEMIGE